MILDIIIPTIKMHLEIMKKRCGDMLEKHLSFEKNKTKPKEKEYSR